MYPGLRVVVLILSRVSRIYDTHALVLPAVPVEGTPDRVGEAAAFQRGRRHTGVLDSLFGNSSGAVLRPADRVVHDRRKRRLAGEKFPVYSAADQGGDVEVGDQDAPEDRARW